VVSVAVNMMDKHIYFLCAPGLGILDNWLPVLYKLKKVAPECKIICVIPKAANVAAVNFENMLARLSENIFDEIIFRSHSGLWLRAPGFSDAKSIILRSVALGKLASLHRRFNHNILTKYFGYIVFVIARFIDYFINSRNRLMLEFSSQNIKIVLYDVYEETKDYNRDFLDQVGEAKRFSIAHGINIDTDPIKPKYSFIKNRENITAYLFSSEEIPYYSVTYGLDKDKQLHLSGIPRHEDSWIQYVQERHSDLPDPIVDGEYVFLISRSLSPYFTYQRKMDAIENIKKLIIDSLNIKIVIKCHPKERDDGLFSKILGDDNYGKTWVISNSHAFVLAKNTLLAITFYSGVSVDMIKMNVPVIEYLDLNGLIEYDNDHSLRDYSGDPIFSYRFHKLVFGVSKYEDLQETVNKIICDREKSTNNLKAVYREKFPEIEHRLELITNTILAAF
jgi:hypothetical protein